MVAHLVSYSHRFKEFYGDHCANDALCIKSCSDTLVLQDSLQASIAELASTTATDVGMHGLLASQSVLPCLGLLPCLCTLWTSSRFLHY